MKSKTMCFCSNCNIWELPDFNFSTTTTDDCRKTHGCIRELHFELKEDPVWKACKFSKENWSSKFYKGGNVAKLCSVFRSLAIFIFLDKHWWTLRMNSSILFLATYHLSFKFDRDAVRCLKPFFRRSHH